MGPDPVIVYISSDEDENDSVTNLSKNRVSFGSDGSDDDCFILEFDPYNEIFDGKGLQGEDSDDVLILNETGQVACRDYPHSRHLCANYPFNASRHDKYCSLCHCYVCDIPAPCKFWGNGMLTTDHCHSTDKGDQWKELRTFFKENNMAFEKFQDTTQSNLQQVQNLLPSHPANSTLVAPAWPRSSGSNKVVSAASDEILKKTWSTTQPVQNTVFSSPVSMTTQIFSASNKVLKKTQSTTQPVQNAVLPCRSPVSTNAPRSSASNQILNNTQCTTQPVLLTIASSKSRLVRKQAEVGDSGALTANSCNKSPRTSKACLSTDKPKSLPLKSISSALLQHSFNLRG